MINFEGDGANVTTGSGTIFAVLIAESCCILTRTTSNGLTTTDVTNEPQHADMILGPNGASDMDL